MENKPHAIPGIILQESKEDTTSVLTKERESFIENRNTEPPLSIYKQVKGEPYTIRYFGLTDWLQLSKMPQFDASGLLLKVSEVEQAITKEIQRRNLQDSPEAYRAIIKEIKDKLHVHPLEKGHIAFEKIHNFFMKYRNKTAYHAIR